MGKLRARARRLAGGLRPARTDPSVQQLAVEVPRLVRRLPTDVDGSIEQRLLAWVPLLVRAVPREQQVREVPAFAKVACHHLATGDVDALHAALTAGLLDLGRHEGSVLDGQPVLHLPGWEDPDVPRDRFVLAERETGFVGHVVRVRRDGDHLDAVVRAGLANVDAPGERPVVTLDVAATYAGETSGHRDDRVTWRETLDRSTWRVRLPVPPSGPALLPVAVALAGRRAAGTIEVPVPEEPSGPAVESLDLVDGTVVVSGRGPVGELTLDGPVRVVASHVERDGDRFRAVLPATASRWGRDPRPLPVGDYLVRSDGAALPLGADLAHWPTDLEDGPLVGCTTTDGLRLLKPRRRDENTMYGQRALRAAYRAADVAVDPDLALFQCYWAEVATDSQAAIDAELRRRRPGTRSCWGVVDHSVPVPQGTTAVVAGTREWYDVLARARFVVKNTEVGDYTRLRPGQVYLQTFHGQPFKTMGRSDFERRMPPWRVDFEATTRRSAYWSAICLPYPEAADFYRDNYDWTGPAFDRGLPRTDALLAPDADATRRRTRELLGIRDDQVAVLHATTWREDLSRGGNRSADPRLLDVHTLADALGDGFVVLQRSHHSVARSDERVESVGGVVDVTDHPEVNDLVLAADVAVLDYSSLRFDWAVTGKPMVFFVPDLQDYEGRLRGFLFDFASSAPGPFVADARDLPGLLTDRSWVDDHAAAYAAFTDRFNRWHDGHAAERVVDGLLAWDA